MEPGNLTTGSPKKGFWPDPREEKFSRTPSKADICPRSQLLINRTQAQGHRIHIQEEDCPLFSENYVPTMKNRYEYLNFLNDDNEYVNKTDFDFDIDINEYAVHDEDINNTINVYNNYNVMDVM